MTSDVDFYFDYSCPYAYIASTRIEGVAARCGAPLSLRPVLLGGVLRELGSATNLADEMSPAKARHNVLDMHRWAALRQVPFSFHPSHPVRSVMALRATLAVGEPYGPLMHAFFKAYWVDNRDLASPAVVGEILRERGFDADAVLARSVSPEIKADLRARTDEALARGVFGVPAMFAGPRDRRVHRDPDKGLPSRGRPRRRLVVRLQLALLLLRGVPGSGHLW
jgi:2-hydroxychromene-2-carboxylate isomerase